MSRFLHLPDDTKKRLWQRSFGRVQGRRLKDDQQERLDRLMPRFSCNTDDFTAPEKLFSPAKKTLNLEIGFGGGEHLTQMAQKNPDQGWIGCEPYINGVCSALKHAEDYALENLRLYNGDARLALEALPENSIDRTYLLFPDPWPKARHHKKRLLTPEFCAMVERVVKKNGVFFIATDHEDYAKWIAKILVSRKALALVKDTSVPPEDWVETRYQDKARQQGRGARYFSCQIL